MNSKFKVGDSVVITALWHRTQESYEIVKPFHNSGWVLSNASAYAEEILELESIYNSPLYQALL